MSAPALEPVVALVAARSGSALSKQQRERLMAAISTKLDGRSVADFMALLAEPRGARELAALMSVVSVHKTDLFRDETQLAALSRHVLEPLARTNRAISLWSAGCATGEEVATLLILLAEAGVHPSSTVLGTDIAEGALNRARQLTFDAESLRRVPEVFRRRYFEKHGDAFRLIPWLAKRARFQVHNLMDTPYPVSADGGDFDLIVCRNVLIYLVPEAAQNVIGQFAKRLKPDGTLALSVTEPLLSPRSDLETRRFDDAFFYVRPQPGPTARLPPLPAPPPVLPSGSSSRASWPGLPMVNMTPSEEGRHLFGLVMEWAAASDRSDETLSGLRKALYLAPELAGARYMLALLLQRQGAKEEAAAEYRRALMLLESGRGDLTHSFLNAERLKAACVAALSRL